MKTETPTIRLREFVSSAEARARIKPGETAIITNAGEPAFEVRRLTAARSRSAADIRKQSRALFKGPRPTTHIADELARERMRR